MSDLQVTSADSQVIKNALYDLDESMREAFFKYSLTSEEQVAVVRAFSENFFIDARYDADTAQHTYEVLTSIEKKVKEANEEGIVKPSTLADYILTTLRVLYLSITMMPELLKLKDNFEEKNLETLPLGIVIYERQYIRNLYAMLSTALIMGIDIKDRDAVNRYLEENGGEVMQELAVFIGRERLNYVEADFETDLREFEKLSDDKVLDKLTRRIEILSLNTHNIEKLNDPQKHKNIELDVLVSEFQALNQKTKPDLQVLHSGDEKFFAGEEIDYSAETISSTLDAYVDPIIDFGDDDDDFVPQTL